VFKNKFSGGYRLNSLASYAALPTKILLINSMRAGPSMIALEGQPVARASLNRSHNIIIMVPIILRAIVGTT